MKKIVLVILDLNVYCVTSFMELHVLLVCTTYNISQHVDGHAECSGETNYLSISFLILLSLVLTKCVVNRLLIIRFVRGFDTLCNVILNTQICKKNHSVMRFSRVTIDV